MAPSVYCAKTYSSNKTVNKVPQRDFEYLLIMNNIMKTIYCCDNIDFQLLN